MRIQRLLSLVLAVPACLALPAVATASTTITNVQSTKTWRHSHDAGTPGTSSGTTAIASSPSKTGKALHLSTSYANYGGERYAASMPDDAYANNFVYDTWVYIKDSAKGVKIIEMDLNHVIGNGWTVIMGFQCNGWSSTWDFTANKGTAKSPNDKWLHSSVKCNPQNWAVNKWHHVQVHYYHDSKGYVTYQSVVLDGVTHKLGARVFSGFALGWGKTVLTNFQVDGATKTSGSSNVFIDKLNVSYW
jgi:hypothetical protein